MGLRTKALLSVGLGLVGLVLVLSSAVRSVILEGFERVESDTVRDSLGRVTGALAVDAAALRGTTTDYAQWDDTYAYAASGESAYLTTNFNADTFERLRLGFALFQRADGRVISRQGYDLPSGAFKAVSDALVVKMTADRELALQVRRARGVVGLVQAGSAGLWLFAAQPIVRSDTSGPTRGTLFVGRPIDRAEIARLADTTHLQLRVLPLRPDGSRRSLGASSPVVRPLGPDRIAGYAPLRDWRDRPIAVVRTLSSRPVLAHGRAVWDLVFFGLIAIAVFGSVTTLILLERTVIGRLREVVAVARHVAESGDLSTRLAVHSEDEVGVVAHTLNGMLGDLERTQAELRDNEKRWRRLVELLPDAVLVHADGVVGLANAAACRMLGVASDAELTGRPIADLVQGPADGVTAAMAGTSLRELGSFAGRLRAVDGRTTEVELREVPFMVGGRPAVQLIAHDVTQRRRLEGQLRQTQKMEALGRLAGGIAHDFNNLATIIGAHSEILLEELPEGDLQESASEILKAGQRAASLTRQLLAFSRKQVLQPRIVDLNGILADVDKMLRRLIGEDIELVVNGCADPWNIKADPGQLEQVLMNLAVNARDAMPRGGRLLIETTNELGDVPAGSWVKLTVRDTGVGMDEATQARVFEPFFTTKAQGTGLGLSTVFGVVQQSGGRIRLRSEPGRGATFELFFPRVFGVPLEPATRPNTVAGGREVILVVEDEDSLRRVVCGVLRRAGYRVLQAHDGQEAMELWRERGHEVDLVLSDVVMPTLGGPDFKRWIDTQTPGATRTIFMSGYTNSETFDEILADTGADFLQKPFTSEELARRVREVLDRSVSLPH